MKILPIYNNLVNKSYAQNVTRAAQGTVQTIKHNSLVIAGKNYTGETTFELVKNYTLDNFHSIMLKHGNCEITPETRYYQDIGADSIDMTTMVAELEYATGYRMPENISVSPSITVQDFVDFIDSHGRRSNINNH